MLSEAGQQVFDDREGNVQRAHIHLRLREVNPALDIWEDIEHLLRVRWRQGERISIPSGDRCCRVGSKEGTDSCCGG